MSKKQLISETFSWTPSRKYKKICFKGIGTVLVMCNPEKRKKRTKIISKAVKKVPTSVKIKSSFDWYNSEIGLRYRAAVKKLGMYKYTESHKKNWLLSGKKNRMLDTTNNPFRFVDGIVEIDVVKERINTCSGVLEDRSLFNA